MTGGSLLDSIDVAGCGDVSVMLKLLDGRYAAGYAKKVLGVFRFLVPAPLVHYLLVRRVLAVGGLVGDLAKPISLLDIGS